MSAGSVFRDRSGITSSEKPTIRTISIPEAKKRRYPTKHYVYKIVVQWSDGSSTTIYRRYSMFFDFQVKLQELFTSLKERLPSFQGDTCPTLPELPGKILFGRTQVHQVAEKRRVKIEEFCKALVNLPSEISHSHLVLSFFNTWAEDTLHHSSSHVIREPTSPITMATSTSPTSPTSSSIISHPEEMDKLEQYRVIIDYERKDSHQVNLTSGQIVHVIEKHYTGWWMIVTEEEQGYAPAAHLESIDKTYDTLESDNSILNEEFEVMETYKTENDDELELYPGDRVTVLSKNMDGWWKIKNSYGVVGYCPATVLRRSLIVAQKPQLGLSCYENEKDLYQELNIHKPPPRRSTLERAAGHHVYKSPKHSKQWSDSSMSEDPVSYYQVPRNNSSTSGSDENTTTTHVDINNPPFSPNHYEFGPEFTEGSSIYENTSFDSERDSGNATAGTDSTVSSRLYQNIDFNDQTMKEKSPAEEEEEYINPEEFKIDEDAIKSINSNSGPIPPDTSTNRPPGNVSYKKVTISEQPLTPPTTKATRPQLVHAKSLNYMETDKNGLPDDEYIDMDPVYAPVAPDEPEQNTNASTNEDSKAAIVQSTGGISGRKPKPSVPTPYKPKPSSGSNEVVPQGRVLERTKSLENILGDGKKFPSPVLGKKALESSIKKHIDYDHLEMGGEQAPPSPSIAKKPDAGRKHLHKSVLSNAPSSPGEFRKIGSPPFASPPHDMTDGAPPPPPLPPPNLSPSIKGSFVPKTYLAIESYESQAPGCLSFNAGDKCILIRQSNGGWWYVNVGGIEGWTPGEFWQEDNRKPSGVALPQPPTMAPKKPVNTKPRSQTQMAPGLEKQMGLNAGQSNLDGRSTSVGSKPLPGKIRGQPAPVKPRPPNLPQPGGAKPAPVADPNPPPLPPPRKGSSNSINPTNGPLKGSVPVNDYTLLENASVPSLEDHMWFAGSMEREKAEQFLMDHGRQREFLVRERTNKKGYYALSIRYHYSVKHFNIDPQSNGSYSMGVMNFASIEEVVKHYQLNSLFIHDGQPVALGQPARRKSKLNH